MKTIYYFFTILISFFVIAISIQSQNVKKVEIVNSDFIEFDKSSGINATKLIGNVRFMHNNVQMDCDSAYFYSEDNVIDAFGHIHVSQGDTIHLYGELLNYNGTSQVAQIRRNVRLVDDETTLTTQFLDYKIGENVGYYFNKGNIVNLDNKLRSVEGYYYAKLKTFFFKNNVVIESPKYTIETDTMKYFTVTRTSYFIGPSYIKSKENTIYCENGWYNSNTNISQFRKNAWLKSNKQLLKGDSLYYDRNTGLGKAFNNIFLIDSSKQLILTGNFAKYIEKPEYALITDKAVMMKYSDEDTLFMHADTLQSVSTDTLNENRFVKGFHHVKFFKPDIQGKCDSMVYSTIDSTMKLFGVPVIWSGVNQLTADSVQMKMVNEELDRVIFYNNSFIAQQEDSISFNQMRGKTMTALFKQNELYKVELRGNGESVYYAKDETKTIGVNKAECTDIDIYIKNRKPVRIVMVSKPIATLYPLDQISDQEKIIKGFVWHSDKRPLTKDDIFIWK